MKVRLRGASARFFPKKSWNVNFPKGVRFEGRTSLNLVAEYADATLLAEKLSYDVLAARVKDRWVYVPWDLNNVDDALFYGPLPEGQRYVRGPSGWEAR